MEPHSAVVHKSHGKNRWGKSYCTVNPDVLIPLCFSGCCVFCERGRAGVSAVVYQRPAAWFGRRLPAGLPGGIQLQLWAGHQQHPGGPVSSQPGQTGQSHAKVMLYTGIGYTCYTNIFFNFNNSNDGRKSDKFCFLPIFPLMFFYFFMPPEEKQEKRAF